jgi:hypothetical protein
MEIYIKNDNYIQQYTTKNNYKGAFCFVCKRILKIKKRKGEEEVHAIGLIFMYIYLYYIERKR